MSDEIWYGHFTVAGIRAVGAYIKNIFTRFGKTVLLGLFSGPTNSIWFSCQSEACSIVRIASLKNPDEIIEDLLL